MLFGAIVLALKAQQLEQEGAALGVGGIVPHLRDQRRDCFVEFTGLEQRLRAHEIRL